MELTLEKTDKNTLYVKYSGKIFIENANDINNTIQNNLMNIKELVFDFSEVPYISSAGLRMISSIHKSLAAQNGSLYIKNANKDVKNVFDISGFLTFLTLV